MGKKKNLLWRFLSNIGRLPYATAYSVYRLIKPRWRLLQIGWKICFFSSDELKRRKTFREVRNKCKTFFRLISCDSCEKIESLKFIRLIQSKLQCRRRLLGNVVVYYHHGFNARLGRDGSSSLGLSDLARRREPWLVFTGSEEKKNAPANIYSGTEESRRERKIIPNITSYLPGVQ